MMNNQNLAGGRKFRLRCTYVKQGRLAYLSHLEVARALERCVRRAGLPFVVSQGFSPHMLLHFGSALPVGIGGTSELFDITLANYVSPARALDALKGASAPDLQVQSCKYVENSAPAVSVAYPISTYEVVLSAALENLEFPEEITLIKKKKERVYRVSDFLVGNVCLNRTQSFQAHDAHGAHEDGFAHDAHKDDASQSEHESYTCLTFSLVAKPTGSLRPDKLMQATLTQYNNANQQDEIQIKKFTRVAQTQATNESCSV